MCRQQHQIGGINPAPSAEIIRTTLSNPVLVSVKTETKRRRVVVEKKVSFSHTVEVEEVISRRDMTSTELKATWYDRLDRLSILIEVKDVVDDFVESLPQVQCWLPWTRARSEVAPEQADICTRGLEHEIDREAAYARSENRKRIVSSVFHAQQKYSKLSTKVSSTSEKHSQQAKDYARMLAKVDENTAADIYYQDMLRGMPLFDYR